jgi:hypothetical protein
VVHTVWVQHGDEDDSRTKSFLDLAVGVLLVAVGQTNAMLVRIEQIGDEVDQIVGSTTLTRVDSYLTG